MFENFEIFPAGQLDPQLSLSSEEILHSYSWLHFHILRAESMDGRGYSVLHACCRQGGPRRVFLTFYICLDGSLLRRIGKHLARHV